MASVNQTRPHCVNQMGKTHSKPLAARNGRGTAWAQRGHGMLCVNRSLFALSTASCESRTRYEHGRIEHNYKLQDTLRKKILCRHGKQ